MVVALPENGSESSLELEEWYLSLQSQVLRLLFADIVVSARQEQPHPAQTIPVRTLHCRRRQFRFKQRRQRQQQNVQQQYHQQTHHHTDRRHHREAWCHQVRQKKKLWNNKSRTLWESYQVRYHAMHMHSKFWETASIWNRVEESVLIYCKYVYLLY